MKSVGLCLRNAKILREGSLTRAGVAIDNGKIVSISKGPSLPEADEEIDLEGSLLLPGVVDPHVHFRDPGLTDKEDFFTGSSAAAAGGVTSICDMPNTSPPTDSPDRFREKRKIGESKSLVDFGLHGMFSESSGDMEGLLDSGAVSLKLYPKLFDDSKLRGFQEEEGIISVHPEDPQMIEKDMEGDDFEAFIRSRPEDAEISEIKRILEYVSGPRIHFCHVTVRESLDIISKAKKEKKVSCEVTPHHLLLDRSHLRESGSIAKMYPPLRAEKDKRALLSALEEGVIDMVATDHAPHTLEEKERGLMESPPGVPGVETSLTLLYTLVHENRLSLSRLIETMCSMPAEIFGLQNEEGVQKGVLTPGVDADLVALDQDRRWKIKGEDLHGKTKFTPFEGREVVGKPFLTLVRGEIVFKDGKVIGEEGHGKFLSRKAQT